MRLNNWQAQNQPQNKAKFAPKKVKRIKKQTKQLIQRLKCDQD